MKRVKNVICGLLCCLFVLGNMGCGKENPVKKAQDLIQIKMYDQALQVLEQEILDHPKNAAAHLLTGKIYLLQEKEPEAQAAFERAILIKTDYRQDVGQVYAQAAGEVIAQKADKALAWYRQAIKADVNLRPVIAQALFQKAAERAQVDHAAAPLMAYLKDSLEFDETLRDKAAEWLYATAKAYIEKGFLADALQLAQACGELQPKFDGPKLGGVYYDASRQFAEQQDAANAVNAFAEGQKLDPAYQPKDAAGLWLLAKSLEAKGERDRAKGVYDQLRQQFPQAPEAQQAQQRLDVLKQPGGTPLHDEMADMDFVWIPAGCFTMGSPETEKDRDEDEGPAHNVCLKDGFWLGKYEVTQAQWQKIMGNNPSEFKGEKNPVETVDWDDAQDFISKLNQKAGQTAYRLPSEAEWEYAARAGTQTAYSFGDDPPQLDAYAWYSENSGSQTHPVGQKKPNAWGLYDMHGNGHEWCQDLWHDTYQDAPADGSAWEYRVLRGGDFRSAPSDVRSADRYYSGPSCPKCRGGGLRLVRTK